MDAKHGKVAEISATYGESDARKENRMRHPILDPGIGCFAARLQEAVSGTSIRAFAAKSGLSEGVLRHYLRGDTFPTLDRLDAIAAAAGKTPGWFIGLEARQAEQSQVLSPEGLKIALKLAAEALDERRATLPPDQHAELVTIIYELLRDGLPEAKILRFARATAGGKGG